MGKGLRNWVEKRAGTAAAELICRSSWVATINDPPDLPCWAGRSASMKRQSLGGDVTALLVGKKLLKKARENIAQRNMQSKEDSGMALKRLQESRQQQRLWMNRSQYKEQQVKAKTQATNARARADNLRREFR